LGSEFAFTRSSSDPEPGFSCYFPSPRFSGVLPVFGIISNIEGIAIKLLLPSWKHDVPSVWHALRLRQAEGRLR